MYYLQQLSPIHVRWHMQSKSTRTLGFLVFHWHVIDALKTAGVPKLWPGKLKPFSLGDFTGFGWPYNVTLQAQSGDFDSLANFSTAIETWHNEAHMAIGMATNTPMMDPGQNVFYLPFWRLHYFINERFLEELGHFDGLGTAVKQVKRLERKAHSAVGQI
jgi:hypothetical protein